MFVVNTEFFFSASKIYINRKNEKNGLQATLGCPPDQEKLKNHIKHKETYSEHKRMNANPK